MRGLISIAAGILAAACVPKAQAAEEIPSEGFWVGAEYLNWSAKGDKLPALVTTSPAGTPLSQAGVLGAPGTTILFGNDTVADGWRSGARLRGGYWFDAQHSQGIEAQILFFGGRSSGFSANSSGSPILAEPFTDAVLATPSASLIAFPTLDSGSIAIKDTSRLFGAGAAYRMELCSGCVLGNVHALAGYRYLRLHDNLAIHDDISPLSAFIPAGTEIAVADAFDAKNNFHGLDIGLTGDIANGPWRFAWRATVALGGTFADSAIAGSTIVTIPGSSVVVSAGGLYAQPTNIGNRSSDRFAVVPEIGLSAGYRLTDNLRAVAGYSWLYWTGLIRPGRMLDTSINTSQLSGGTLTGAARPRSENSRTTTGRRGSLWVWFTPTEKWLIGSPRVADKVNARAPSAKWGRGIGEIPLL